MKDIVFLDAKTIGEVSNFRVLEKLGNLKVYENSKPDEVVERSKGCEILITNKVQLTREILGELPDLRLICVTATGVNNVDTDYTNKNNILVKNVASYSTESVAQHTFTMLLYLINRPALNDTWVKTGNYSRSELFTYFGQAFWELSGKRLGIIGLGTIGRRVAQIATAFGMEVVFYSTTGRNNNINYKRFDLNSLLSTSDVISIHAPLNEQTSNLIGYEQIKSMRPCAILLNTGRGGIINETELAKALNENLIGGAGLDVFQNEPIESDNPLLKVYDKDKLLLTPHVAWTSIEARQRLIEKLANNIRNYSEGQKRQFETKT